jgi:CopG family nickel-responsive transcriptional regulator
MPPRPRTKSKKDKLVRFGVAMEESLLAELDRVVDGRGSTRSEAFRDMARALVSRSKARSHVEAVGALTLVYDHHVRDLTHTLTEMQHDLGERVRSAMHVHLTNDLCLEVIVLRGHADELQAVADRILGTRGVTHGAIEIVAMGAEGHAHPHAHDRDPPHDHAHPVSPRRRDR